MNILLLSTIYPLPDKENKGTSVCHYFASEWAKMGHKVRVVHYQAVYPAPFYWAARLARNKISAKTGAVVYTERDKGAIYERDGVKIYRIPLFKPIPHGRFTHAGIKRSINSIIEWMKEDDFAPDVITGHFPNPQIEVVSALKEIWPQSKTAVVMHLEAENLSIKRLYGKRFEEMCKKIDVWGFRNEPLRRLFEKEVMPVKNGFICYSGIPESYITENNVHVFNEPLNRFVYVGEMIERKYPVEVLVALQKVYIDGNFNLTYIGQGALLNEIRDRAERNGFLQNVRILGKIPRDNIKEEYDKAECMVMISKGEAYGLVYLEAMARGCITIASREEGFDGVIQDGKNGFLCKAGDSDELASIIKRINALSSEERQAISDNAIETARSLTDYKAAKRYLDDLLAN